MYGKCMAKSVWETIFSHATVSRTKAREIALFFILIVFVLPQGTPGDATCPVEWFVSFFRKLFLRTGPKMTDSGGKII